MPARPFRSRGPQTERVWGDTKRLKRSEAARETTASRATTDTRMGALSSAMRKMSRRRSPRHSIRGVLRRLILRYLGRPEYKPLAIDQVD